MRSNERRNVLTRGRVNFGQSKTSSLLRGRGEGVVKIFVTTDEGELTENIPIKINTEGERNSTFSDLSVEVKEAEKFIKPSSEM